jgi:hypothetical protein
MRFYEWVDIMGNRYYVDDDGNNTADTTFSQDFTVYLECVLADVRDSNGRYREDIRWDARVVMENS